MEHLKREKADALYKEATLIANTYASDLYNNETTLESVKNQLDALDTYLSATLWIINPSGRLVLCSNEPINVENEIVINNFDPTITEGSYYTVGNFFDTFTEEQLSVFAPITSDFKVRGYVVIHYPMSNLTTSCNSLLNIFNGTDMLIATHCESQEIIKKNTEYYKEMFRNAPEIPISKHPNIRSVAACYSSSQLAIRMASLAGARLHVLHVSTAKELQLFSDAPLEDKHITAEACIAHLLYRQQDYKELGTRIKCNPSIKKQADRDALRNAVNTGVIDVIATDHAPHLLSEKEGGALKAMSGMPMIQFSLVSMLELAEKGIFSIETIVEKMCHAPAQIYGICNRGYIREGYQADLVLVSHGERWEVNTENILSKCGWSPLEGNSFRWKVEKTFANGHLIYSDGQVDDTYRGEELRFDY